MRRASRRRLTLVAVREDQLVPLGGHARAGVAPAARAGCTSCPPPYGHDAFLKEAAQLQADLQSSVWSSLSERVS